MNFLITGAAGFLGSTLANQLAREGHQVRGLDDLSTGDPQALSPDVHFTRGDVSDRPKLWTLLQEVDVVYHLAARVSVPESILYPRDYNNVNVGGTEVTGQFSPDLFSRLTPNDFDFVVLFLKARGNIKEMERELGISYWTIRSKLNEIVDGLGLEPGESQPEEPGPRGIRCVPAPSRATRRVLRSAARRCA